MRRACDTTASRFTRLVVTAAITTLAASCGKSSNDSAQTAAPVAAASFTGAAVCADCHPAESDAWQGSHHDLAMQVAGRDTVLGNFSDVTVEHFGASSRFFVRDGKYWVSTRDQDGELRDFRIDYTFGVEPLQQYLVETTGGRLQALPFAWDTRKSRWFHLYPDEAIPPDDPLHWTRREQNWNYMCAECHSTDLQKNFTLKSDSFDTTWSDIDVSCEACHGPGSDHVERAQYGTLDDGSGLLLSLNDHSGARWRMDPDTGIAARQPPAMSMTKQPEACGRCHARRGLATADYEYGKPLADTHTVSLLDEPLYFADGQIREEVYVYGSFVQSKMYQAGVTCTDCHDAHTARLKTDGEPSDSCSACHLAERFADTAHHRHPQDTVECVDCHMPARDYMVVDPRRDHSFRVPRPFLTEATGSPNACNQCHDDRDAEWASNAVAAWYGEPDDTHFALAIHAGREGRDGANAALRAVIRDDAVAGIVRATALTLLRSPLADADVDSVRAGLTDADALLRIGALRALQSGPSERTVQLAAPLLDDAVRSVRLAAVDLLSPLRQLISVDDRGAFERAEREYIDAQLAIAERPEAIGNLANLLREGGRHASAESYFLHALGEEPAMSSVRANLADLYRELGREQDAETLLRAGIALDENDAALHHSLGLLLVRTGRGDQAMEALERAVELQPDSARFNYVYAIALNSSGRGDAAVALLQDAQTRLPADFDTDYALVTMLLERGDIQGARDAAALLLERYPDDANVRALLQSMPPA